MATTDGLFGDDSTRSKRFRGIEEQIRNAVEAATENEVVHADTVTWAELLAEELRADVPRVAIEAMELHDLGKTMVDCAGMAGITYTNQEFGGPIMREGVRLRLVFPVSGELELLCSRPSHGGGAMRGRIEDDRIVRDFEWPLVKGDERLQADIVMYQNELRQRCAAAVVDVERFNSGLKQFAEQAITARKAWIKQRNSLLDGLTIPVTRRDDAPRSITMPPSIRPRRTAAKTILPPAPRPPSGVQLGTLYNEILAHIQTMGRGLERTPSTFASQDEESLRDHLLLMLNSHYEGNAHAEAFNKRGKTDILIAFQELNLFIAECKWWSGPAAMSHALDQLYGYSTWRDSRLALIFFVEAADFMAIVDKARAHMASRSEFRGWEERGGTPNENEMHCRISWPDDPDRQATLAIVLFNLPRR